MAKKSQRSTKVTELRRQAEARLRMTKRDVAAMPVKEVQELVHELQVHQIELEMQNDELRRTQLELEAVRDRYVDLYDFSPVGHLTLDTHGTIVEANLRAGTLLGFNRNKLIGQPIAGCIAAGKEDMFHRYCQKVLKTGTLQICEVLLRLEAGVSRWIQFEGFAVQDAPGPITHWRTALMDVSDRKRAEQQLEAQRAQREDIIGSTMDAIITMDEQGRVVRFNPAAESIFLCSPADAIGQLFTRYIPERFRQTYPKFMRDLASAKLTARLMGRPGTLFGLRTTGEEFPFEASISHIYGDGKDLFTIILRDITERMIAEELLQSSNVFFRSVLDSLSSHVCVLDGGGIIRQVNDAWETLAREGAPRMFVLGKVEQNYLDLVHRVAAGGLSSDQAIPRGLVAVLEGHEPIYSVEYCAQVMEEERWFLMRMTPLKGGKGIVIVHTDISARVRMGLELEQHVQLLSDKQEQLETLTGKLIETQEQERRRIARDLHDDFNQRLAALSVELESIERAPSALSEPIVRHLVAIRGQVGQLSDDLHDLAYRLHPSLLEHVGLEIAVREHVAEFTKRTGLPVTFIAREVPRLLQPELATSLFRLLQESLQNVLKHAQATSVTVRLSGSSKGIGLSVRDNGKGFDMDTHTHRAGLGLMSMQERARLLGGFFLIHSGVTQGTKVCAWVPLSREDV